MVKHSRMILSNIFAYSQKCSDFCSFWKWPSMRVRVNQNEHHSRCLSHMLISKTRFRNWWCIHISILVCSQWKDMVLIFQIMTHLLASFTLSGSVNLMMNLFVTFLDCTSVCEDVCMHVIMFMCVCMSACVCVVSLSLVFAVVEQHLGFSEDQRCRDVN